MGATWETIEALKATWETIEAVKAKTREGGFMLSALRDLANMTPLDEPDDYKRVVGVAVESVYRDAYALTVAGLSCDRLTARNRDKVDGNGYYHDRACRAESNAINRELERRHPEIEPTDTYDNRDSATSYSEHERRVYMGAPACDNHGGEL